MKIKSLPLIAMLAAITLMYAACKKSDTTSTTVINTSDISKQIAVSLYKSLAGQYGGANINDGIKAPSSLTPTLKGPRINSTTSPYCGYTIDTTYYSTQTVGDTVKGLAAILNLLMPAPPARLTAIYWLIALPIPRQATHFQTRLSLPRTIL